MGIPRLFSMTRRAAVILPLVAALSACATGGLGRPVLDTAEDDAVVDRGPRVQIWTRSEPHTTDQIRASFRLEDDAYVIVVNVGRDGFANVIFPESPEDDGFMRGGRTYRLPSFFPGFARHTGSEYRRLYTSTSAYDEVYDRYAGYVFVIASWRPMHFQLSEALGLWDSYRLAVHEERLDPYVVMHRFADQLVPGRTRDYTARFARYSAFPPTFAGQSSFASCAAYQSAFGGVPPWAYGGLISNGWVPVYGFGYSALGPAGCGHSYGLRILGFRPGSRPVMPQPAQPIPPRDSSDTTGARPSIPVRPRAVDRSEDDSDRGRRKSPPHRRRSEVVADEDPIVDVTRESRARARRENSLAERRQRALAAEDGYRSSDDWRQRARAASRDGSEQPREAERSRSPASDNEARAQRERVRDEARSERHDPPPRPERHAAPRSEPRSQPAPRSEPAPRAEPRSERPAKPERR
jgi:hypothetical protein